MKRLLFLVSLCCLALAGCRSKALSPAPEKLFHLTDGVTEAGIQAGDGKREFCAAYEDYEILVSLSQKEVPNETMPIRRIPYYKEIATMIANFFIDGQPMSTQDICKKEGVDPGDLFSLLSSASYLREHEVIYRYLLFYWENSKIQRIVSDELNYNETYEVPSAW